MLGTAYSNTNKEARGEARPELSEHEGVHERKGHIVQDYKKGCPSLFEKQRTRLAGQVCSEATGAL